MNEPQLSFYTEIFEAKYFNKSIFWKATCNMTYCK